MSAAATPKINLIMKVLKFGGTSVANADKFREVAAIVAASQQFEQTAVVLSAPATVTNLLHQALEVGGDAALAKVETICFGILDGLYDYCVNSTSVRQANVKAGNFPEAASQAQVVEYFDVHFANGRSRILAQWQAAVEAVQQYRQAPSERLFAFVVSVGERLSIGLMQTFLEALGHQVGLINPVDYLVGSSNYLETVVDLPATQERFANFSAPAEQVLLMPGFFAGYAGSVSEPAPESKELVLLGRNGSDYSAALLACSLKASACEIWTDVDGVYTCDPNQVSDAKLLTSMSYQEAMELSYFGAKVIHPKTIAPIAQYKIPCFIKNTKNPFGPGTVILDANDVPLAQRKKIKGITSLANIDMFNISGPCMKGTVGIAARIFNVISATGASLILITQSSSEYSIGFCLNAKDSAKVKAALEADFAQELASGALDPIEVAHDLAIVSVIGDHMKYSKGTAAKFFAALAQTNINIIAIAQGSSERAISTVIKGSQALEAVRSVHRQLFNSKQVIRAFIVGVGGVGSELIEQIRRQKEFLNAKNIEISICGIANSRKCLVNVHGLDLDDGWKDLLEAQGSPFSLQSLIKHIEHAHVVNPVFVDCTSSQEVADSYLELLQAGFNIVTPNKKANTSAHHYYLALRNAAQTNQRRFMYETNVGAGLPVIENLQNLLAAGDEIVEFNGILSGSLSYIFGKLEEGMTISQVTASARKLGFTEPDPRDDLSGQDVARKLLILARESGLNLELEDVIVEPVLPQGFCEGESTEVFMQRLPELDEQFSRRVQAAKEQGKVLRYVGQIHNGVCRCSIVEVDKQHPLYAVKDGENALAFYTRYYHPIPLLLRGYGAGNSVTAAGIFSDILRTLQSYSSVR